MYRLFYNFKVIGDVLLLVLDPSMAPDHEESHGAITALYAGDQLIGVNFFDFSKIVKLHTEGMIVTPEDKLIDVINAELENAKLPRLPYTRDSGYHVGKIVSLEEHPLDEKAQIVHLDFGAGKVLETTSHYPNLSLGELLVCALDGTITFDGTRFNAGKIRNIGHDADICCEKELRIGEDVKQAFILKDGYEPGDDFYLGGH
jgi:tRNA-binding EMAP/Myf-like protein